MESMETRGDITDLFDVCSFFVRPILSGCGDCIQLVDCMISN